jgi:hypothetical protein
VPTIRLSHHGASVRLLAAPFLCIREGIMRSELSVKRDWQTQIVATRSRFGDVYLLLGIRKSPCRKCHSGIRILTTWRAESGDADHLTWCTTCFNADLTRAEPDEEAAAAWQALQARLVEEPIPHLWSNARSAIADLERRGLV